MQHATCKTLLQLKQNLQVASKWALGGAMSHACQSGARSVSKRLIPSIGRYAVIRLGLGMMCFYCKKCVGYCSTLARKPAHSVSIVIHSSIARFPCDSTAFL